MSYISDLRKYIGHKPIMATAALGIIYDESKGLILFEKRSDTGEWCIPGGCLELGETGEQGLAREVKEETNLDISNPEFFTVRPNMHMKYPNGDEVYYTDLVYIVKEFNGELKPDKESTELKWFNKNSLPDNIIPNETEYILKFTNKKTSH